MARVIIQPESAGNLRDLIRSAVESELKAIDFGIAKTKRKLGELEKEFGMNTREFYEDFQKGKLGDDLKFIRWAGEVETAKRVFFLYVFSKKTRDNIEPRELTALKRLAKYYLSMRPNEIRAAIDCGELSEVDCDE